MKISNKKVKTSGFSLVEILVSLFILAVGTLGVISVQTLSLKNSIKSVYRGHAANISYEIIDRMRANPNTDYSIAAGANTIPTLPATANCLTNTCNTSEIKDFDLAEWKCNFLQFQSHTTCVLLLGSTVSTYAQDQISLNGDASVACTTSTSTGEKSCAIQISWKEDQIYSSTEKTHSYSVTVII